MLLLLLKLWNYLRGYVIIIVEGYFIEKFLNICSRRQILLWDVKVQKDHILTMRMSINGFKLIRPIAKKTGCKVRLLKKIGLPFVFNRYRRRKAFFAGALLFVALIYAMTSFIWSIEITGNKNIETSRLESILSESGIKTGALKYSINTDNAVSNMLLGTNDISWVSIVLKGTKVKVELRERLKVPEIIPRHEPCDIVASKDGLIKQVIATEGIEAAGEGDTVKKGQVLISGKIPLKGEENKFRLAHAMGTVSARTWYEEEEAVILSKYERQRTGNVINHNSLILFSRKLDMFHKKISFRYYEITEVRKKLSIGEDLVFPIEWVTVNIYEESVVPVFIKEEDAREAAIKSAYKKLTEQLSENAEIIKKDVKFIERDEKGLVVKVILECVEDIGTSKLIREN